MARCASNSPHAMSDSVLDLPFGRFGICIADDCIVELRFLPPDTPPRVPDGELARRTETAIHAWLEHPHGLPALPFARRGTAFQQRVWQLIAAVPAGETRTYGMLAHDLGSAPRAVGQACGANPFPLFVPCHRITAASGIGGFANAHDGWLIDTKRWLLEHEARHYRLQFR